MRRAARAAVLLAAVFATAAPRALADGPAPSPASSKDEILIREALWIPPVGVSRREATHTDAIEAQIVAGTWEFPKAGEKVTLPDGSTKEWTEAKANDKGWFEGPNLEGGGYLYARVSSETERVMLLHGVGHDLVYANGEPRPGDPYAYGWLRLPVLMRKGDNDFLFRVSRGRLSAKLVPPPEPVFVSTDDATMPDLRRGDASGEGQIRGAVVIVNATADRFVGSVHWSENDHTVTTATPVIALSMAKVPIGLPPRPTPKGGATSPLILDLRSQGVQGSLGTVSLDLRVREPGEVHRRTYVSDVDGSVQYYAVNPPRVLPPRALILTLHGAGVEALGQADAYSPKSWAAIVAPTNRRPYGFDWEDWGRTDAIAVLDRVLGSLWLGDPRSVYLTGHSMGGHGTWQIGAHFPDRFAAIGPSAGWTSFASYAGGPAEEPKTPIERILRRAASPSDTLALTSNYERLGVYVLHGDADDNVPITEARHMVDVLKGFHHDFLFHEQKGAGHWWDVSDEPGADCVDWPPMLDFFARHRLPADDEVREIDFATSSPGVSAKYRWASIEAQVRPLETSRIRLRCDPAKRRITGSTENVARLRLDVARLGLAGAPLSVEIDGAKFESVAPREDGAAWMERRNADWTLVSEPPASVKGPHRCGPFKAAFGHRFQLVYGTKGKLAETQWAAAKARYDAEAWYYRANGSVDVVPDTEFDPKKEPDRSVILYGNADTNAAWDALLHDSPVTVRKGSVEIGSRRLTDEDLACLFVRPRPGSDFASVGVVAGTSPRGMRLTERLPYFTSGVHYPDVTVIGTEMLSKGVEGVRVAGFFGNDWGVETGEFAWRDEK